MNNYICLSMRLHTPTQVAMFALFLLFMSTSRLAACELKLIPADIYQGLKAERVALTPDEKALTLDPRNALFPLSGLVETGTLDPQDPQNRLVAEPETWTSLKIKANASIPPGSAVQIEVRTGDRFFSDSGWSEWTRLPSLVADLPAPRGRFIRLRLTLRADKRDPLPTVSSISLYPVHQSKPPYAKRLRLVSYMNDRTVTGQQDQSAMKATRMQEKKITLEFGHSLQAFKRFVAAIDDSAAREVPAHFIWTINPGPNKLKVFPEDEKGKRGRPSLIAVYY